MLFTKLIVKFSTFLSICFTSDIVLEFNSEAPITGINIIDDMLFWTDNFTEPKKINVSRSVQGTHDKGDTHTKVVRENSVTSKSITKDYVTVIRKAPKNN